MTDHLDEHDAIDRLNEIDKQYGINKPIEEVPVDIQSKPPVTSLGKAKSYQDQLTLSAVEDSPWKILNLNLVPSAGMFYPIDIELLLKSAKTKEIRHWSTMDETDPIDIREKINFVLNKCTKFKIKGSPAPFNFNDYCDIDKYHILFRIYELTFPNQENKLMANIKCDNPSCNHINKIQVTSRNLIGFEIPEDILKWYSEEERCFVVPSEKLGETLRFYMPTIGMISKFRQKREKELEAGIEIDEAFYNYGPYMLTNWRKITLDDIHEFKMDSINNWSDSKFTIVHKFTEALKKNSINRVIGVCEKCKSTIESSIFLRGSFTTKDIFIISAGLDELI